jgi:hypothetical protein
MPCRSFQGIRNARLERMRDGRPKGPIRRIPRAAILLVGTTCLMSQADHGRVADGKLVALFQTLFSFHFGDIQIPSVKAKNVIERAGHAFSRKVRQLFVAGTRARAQFTSQGFGR